MAKILRILDETRDRHSKSTLAGLKWEDLSHSDRFTAFDRDVISFAPA
jgi:hypothetical protein